jgi:hypothetical protein
MIQLTDDDAEIHYWSMVAFGMIPDEDDDE